jgi:elongator complex protein 2
MPSRSRNTNNCNIDNNNSATAATKNRGVIIAAFSDGTITSWACNDCIGNNNNDNENYNHCGWEEHVLIGNDPLQTATRTTTSNQHNNDMTNDYRYNSIDMEDMHESIADISAIALSFNDYNKSDDNNTTAGITQHHQQQQQQVWLVASASSRGVFLHVISFDSKMEDECEKKIVSTRQLTKYATTSVHLQHCLCDSSSNISSRCEMSWRKKECYIFSGSALPRNNKIWVHTIVYQQPTSSSSSNDDGCVGPVWIMLPLLTINEPQYHGHLSGHQDWITCFACLDLSSSSSLLASSGHDAKIRLWKLTSRITTTATTTVGMTVTKDDRDDTADDDDDDDDDESLNDEADDLEEEEEGEARLTIVHSSSTTTAVSLEALLLGHEESVTSLSWKQPTSSSSSSKSSKSKPCLLSSSMDRTILLWMEEENDYSSNTGGGVWVPISRVGSAGGILGGPLGASLMGFVDAAFSPLDGSRIVGHGYGGSIHFWTQVGGNSSDAVDNDDKEEEMLIETMSSARWVADPCITGHFGSVEDMAWDTNGEYLLTTSLDQTTRLWTEVPVMMTPTSSSECRWVEVGRPQVHGYDMTSIACIGRGDDDDIDSGEPRHRFISGADEKLLRVFDAPTSTLRLLKTISQSHACHEIVITNQTSPSPMPSWRYERAFMPSLGLSNKATADTDQESSKYSGPVNDDDDDLVEFTAQKGMSAVELSLPSERDLGVTTLWPETRKLFGHESEVVCLDSYCAPSGKCEPSLVASSCKARNNVASAAIRLWDVKRGKCVQILKGGHRSTVSTMSFSRNGKYLASSGKDRRICIWRRRIHDQSMSNPDEFTSGYELSAAADSAHKRIIWSIHFCPKSPDILASGSRDGLIKIWRVVEAIDGALELKQLVRFEPSFKKAKTPITAVAFAEDLFCGIYDNNIECGILSIGTECGRIEIWAIPIFSPVLNDNGIEYPSPKLLHTLPANDTHFDTVNKIAWRPGMTSVEAFNPIFASCGRDSGVRIYKLELAKTVTKLT